MDIPSAHGADDKKVPSSAGIPADGKGWNVAVAGGGGNLFYMVGGEGLEPPTFTV